MHKTPAALETRCDYVPNINGMYSYTVLADDNEILAHEEGFYSSRSAVTAGLRRFVELDTRH